MAGTCHLLSLLMSSVVMENRTPQWSNENFDTGSVIQHSANMISKNL